MLIIFWLFSHIIYICNRKIVKIFLYKLNEIIYTYVQYIYFRLWVVFSKHFLYMSVLKKLRKLKLVKRKILITLVSIRQILVSFDNSISLIILRLSTLENRTGLLTENN